VLDVRNGGQYKMKDYYTDEMIQILAKYGIDNDSLAKELAEYIDEEQFQARCDSDPDN